MLRKAATREGIENSFVLIHIQLQINITHFLPFPIPPIPMNNLICIGFYTYPIDYLYSLHTLPSTFL